MLRRPRNRRRCQNSACHKCTEQQSQQGGVECTSAHPYTVNNPVGDSPSLSLSLSRSAPWPLSDELELDIAASGTGFAGSLALSSCSGPAGSNESWEPNSVTTACSSASRSACYSSGVACYSVQLPRSRHCARMCWLARILCDFCQCVCFHTSMQTKTMQA